MAYPPADCSTSKQKDEFSDKLATLARKSKGYDIIMLAGDVNAQIEKLSASETCLRGHGDLSTHCTSNGDRLSHFCADNHLLLPYRSFQHGSCRIVTCRSNATDSLGGVESIVLSYRWRDSGPPKLNQIMHHL